MTHAAALVLRLLILGQVFVDWLSLPLPGCAVSLLLLATFVAIRCGPESGTAQLFDAARRTLKAIAHAAEIVALNQHLVSNSESETKETK